MSKQLRYRGDDEEDTTSVPEQDLSKEDTNMADPEAYTSGEKEAGEIPLKKSDEDRQPKDEDKAGK